MCGRSVASSSRDRPRAPRVRPCCPRSVYPLVKRWSQHRLRLLGHRTPSRMIHRIFDWIGSDGTSRPSAGSQPRDIVSQPAVAPGARVVEMQPLYPAYVLPLTAVTLALLLITAAFMARLLDAIARPVSAEQLSTIAGWGWSLLGLGFMLLVWGTAILPRASHKGHSIRSVAPALLISMIVCCETVYLIGPAVIHHVEYRTTATERRCALYLRVLAAAQQEGVPIPLGSGIRMALLAAPITGLSCAHVASASPDGLVSAVRGIATRRLGTAEETYDSAFIPSVRSLRDAYNEYAAAQLRLVNDIQAIPDQQLNAWQRYLEQLAQTGHSLSHIPRSDWARIAAEVRATGIPVPTDWKPTDRASFTSAVATALRQTADAAYNNFVMQRFQQLLPPGLDWDSFYRQSAIQDRWRAMIGAPTTVSLAPNMGFQTFRDLVYEPQLERRVRPELDDLLSAAGNFAPAGRLGRAGAAAAAWVIVPTALLYVTMVCILWQVALLVRLGGLVLLPRADPSMRWAIAGGLAFAFLAITLSPMLGAGSFQTRPAPQVGQRIPPALELFWTLGSGLRQTAFLGFGFGYDPAFAGERDQERLTPLLHPERSVP